MMNEDGPVRGGKSDPGKGSVTRPPNDGELWQDNDNTDTTVVRGDSKGFGEAGSKTGFDTSAPVWLEGFSVDGNAVNAMGAIGAESKSDPMFDRFKPEVVQSSESDIDANRGGGTNSPDSVASGGFPGSTDSDPEDQDLPVDPNK